MLKPKIRLYVDFPIKRSVAIKLSVNQLHYLKNVMRSEVCLIFNGTDGEWSAQLVKDYIIPLERLYEQKNVPSKIVMCFAIIKKPAINILVKQATELGVSLLQPVITEFTVAKDFNREKLLLQAIEAAEQCKRMTIPLIREPMSFTEVFLRYNNVVAVHNIGDNNNVAILADMPEISLMIGPEGGFSEKEVAIFLEKKNVIMNLGENILRAETAATVAFTYAQLLKSNIKN